MEWINITEKNKSEYNSIVNHPLQAFEWGEFREKTGVKVIRHALVEKGKITDGTSPELAEGFTLTIHKIPKTKFTIGYLPKGNTPTKELLEELKRIGKENNCIFIQLEPNIERGVTRSGGPPTIARNEVITSGGGAKWQDPKLLGLRPSFHPLFTKYTFVLDLSKSEEELLKSFHSKTRYNIKVAQKHNVKVEIDNSEIAFKEYLRLTEETTARQKFFAHTPSYHTKMWETLKANGEWRMANGNELSAHLLTASYHEPHATSHMLASWILFSFHNHLYYPYGASSGKFRNVMASNLIMWEAIKFGKKMGLKYFDMWGALSSTPDPKDPWYGFHKFKEGYGATHTEFIGSYDLVINPMLYELYKVADKARWIFLKSKRLFS